MVQFKIVSGKMAGTEKVARHFPFTIGRSASADLQLADDGVWDKHLELLFDPAAGFVLNTHPSALAAINGQPFQQAVLRNGDSIEIGTLKIRFWLGETRQKSLRPREYLTWAAFVLIVIAQFCLIYSLIP
ncbi:MAG TPA: FHA domain-containing protein [Verrucomicrobiae bacterium]|jgi:pSer/pThr/pTyr-binding forkhead associated (FHA) protein|nr:FHA domain-containing protein [Verrucomicrobiae bacterium]HEX4264180.1 FHA domain-containing protein [Verrucomicrobiae bacterium]